MTGMIRKPRKVRVAGIVRKPRRKSEEHKLQVKLLGVIELEKTHPDIYAFAIPNAGRRSLRTGAKMKAEGLRSGVGDLCIMLPEAKTAWLELKARKGVQSTSQKGFGARCARLGHPYAVAYTMEEAVTALRNMGVIR